MNQPSVPEISSNVTSGIHGFLALCRTVESKSHVFSLTFHIIPCYLLNRPSPCDVAFGSGSPAGGASDEHRPPGTRREHAQRQLRRSTPTAACWRSSPTTSATTPAATSWTDLTPITPKLGKGRSNDDEPSRDRLAALAPDRRPAPDVRIGRPRGLTIG